MTRFKIGDTVLYQKFRGVIDGGAQEFSDDPNRILHRIKFQTRSGHVLFNLYDDNPQLIPRYPLTDYDLGDIE